MPSLYDILDTYGFNHKLIAIFIFVLIISNNYLKELFPCKVQRIFNDNIIVKQILGYLTLVFFVALTIPELSKSKELPSITLIIYLWFLIMTKTHYIFWFTIFGLLGIVYILDIYEKSQVTLDKDKIGETLTSSDHEQSIIQTNIISVKYIIIFVIMILTVIGFLIYMGSKKIQYGNRFNYNTFLFGKPTCDSTIVQKHSLYTLLKSSFK